eukprot:6455449-Amphidinium_carterae.1
MVSNPPRQRDTVLVFVCGSSLLAEKKITTNMTQIEVHVGHVFERFLFGKWCAWQPCEKLAATSLNQLRLPCMQTHDILSTWINNQRVILRKEKQTNQSHDAGDKAKVTSERRQTLGVMRYFKYSIGNCSTSLIHSYGQLRS